MFTDHVRIQCIAGKGGNGVVAWRREKFLPKGGPSGGNGGPGGSVIFRCEENLSSLDAYRNRRVLKARNGQQGGSQNRQGKAGAHLVLPVPQGTLLKDFATQALLCDFTQPGQQWLLCQGGKGGKGNTFFKTSVHRTPNQCTHGLEGETKTIELELKLIADVGFVGFPNAGKSTLLSSIAPVKAKIGAYPFTTLQPNISYLEFDDFSRISIADIPGIIEGAHRNRGLGLSFLKHVERAKTLVYLVDISEIERGSALEDFMTLQKEVRAYSQALTAKPFLVVLNKMDTPDAEKKRTFFSKHYPFPKDTLLSICAKTGQGTAHLIAKMRALAQKDGTHY